MIENCLVKYSRDCIKKPTHAVFLLHGRGCNAENMLSAFDTLCDIKNLIVFSIEPEKEWYPIPNGSSDQESAIHGLDENLPKIREFILKTLEECKLTIDKTILIGFSAGAVVSLQLAIKFQDPYKLIICHSGAILNPECVSKSQIDTSFVLIHHQDDFCFSWDERYIPMRKSLCDNDYKVMTIESVSGNHTIYNNELKNIKNLISEIVS